MKRVIGKVLLLAMASGLPACAWFHPREKEKKKEEPKSRLVGRIASISGDKTFVLIQSYGTWEIPIGSILTTEGEEKRVSNLRNTGEKLGQFAAADIQAGLPLVGDAVFSTAPPPPEPVPATPTVEKPKTPETIPPPGAKPAAH